MSRHSGASWGRCVETTVLRAHSLGPAVAERCAQGILSMGSCSPFDPWCHLRGRLQQKPSASLQSRQHRASGARSFPTSPISPGQSSQAASPRGLEQACVGVSERIMWHPVFKAQITKDKPGHFEVFTPRSPRS